MKISIVTTAYNAEKYIEETLESVLQQRGEFELEYIVIDAKSKDSTLDIINKYKLMVDSGFYSGRNLGISMKVLSEPDNGMYDGIAKGFRLVTGDLVAYINADDFYLPNAFSTVSEIFSTFDKINWLTGRSNAFSAKGQSWESILQAHYHQKYITKGLYGRKMPVIQQESTFWRRNLLNSIVASDFRQFKYAGDFYLWHQFATENKLYIVNSNLAGFRFSDGQKSEDRDSYAKEFDEIVGQCNLTPAEKLEISFLKQSRRLSDKHKLRKNPDIIRYNLAKSRWELG